MLPTIPTWIFLVIPMLFIIYNFLNKHKYSNLPLEVFSIGALFAGLIIGFIIVFAMQKFDIHSSNRNLFTQKILRLQRLEPTMRDALVDYTKAYLEYKDSDVLLPWLTSSNPIVVRTIQELDDLTSGHINSFDSIPNIIWYTVLISIIIITILVVIDGRIPNLMSLGAIILIWLPVIVIYYIYISRDTDTDRIIRELLEKLKSK